MVYLTNAQHYAARALVDEKLAEGNNAIGRFFTGLSKAYYGIVGRVCQKRRGEYREAREELRGASLADLEAGFLVEDLY